MIFSPFKGAPSAAPMLEVGVPELEKAGLCLAEQTAWPRSRQCVRRKPVCTQAALGTPRVWGAAEKGGAATFVDS